MVWLVNFHTHATRIGWHLWEIDLRFAPGLPPGRLCALLFVALTPTVFARTKHSRNIAQRNINLESFRPSSRSATRPSHESTCRQSPEMRAALISKQMSSRGSGGAHCFVCFFQAALWHAVAQYEACLLTEQRLSEARFFPQCEQLVEGADTLLLANAGSPRPYPQTEQRFSASRFCPQQLAAIDSIEGAGESRAPFLPLSGPPLRHVELTINHQPCEVVQIVP